MWNLQNKHTNWFHVKSEWQKNPEISTLFTYYKCFDAEFARLCVYPYYSNTCKPPNGLHVKSECYKNYEISTPWVELVCFFIMFHWLKLFLDQTVWSNCCKGDHSLKLPSTLSYYHCNQSIPILSDILPIYFIIVPFLVQFFWKLHFTHAPIRREELMGKNVPVSVQCECIQKNH